MLYRLTHRFSIDPAGRQVSAVSIAGAAAAYRARRPDLAADICHGMLADDPWHPDALHLLGVICTERNEPEQALAWLIRAEREEAHSARLQYHIGNALLALERHADAEAHFRAAVALDPELVDAYNNLGTALRAQGQEDAAEACYHRIVALRPDYPAAHYNLGLAQAKRGDLDAAVVSFRTALGCRVADAPPERLADVHDSLARVLIELERCDEALAICRARQALRPDDPGGEWHEALALLTLGRFAEAWPKYERRWELPGFRSEGDPPAPPVPDVTDLHGRRVLLRAEQGRGDVIQFARYVPHVAAIAASVALVVPDDLVALMRSVPGAAEVIADRESDPPHDIAAALLSLPLILGTDLNTVPADVPYLHPQADRLDYWRQRIGPRSRPRVGLCWRGSQHIPERSMPLADLTPLLSRRDVELHAIQIEIPDSDRACIAANPAVTLHEAALTDFAETAALLWLMDLVISVDTSVAHLAGALGRPTWIMLRRTPDWRWLLGRQDSPWYPTVRLFRQDRCGGWPAVVDAVHRALADCVSDPR
ncbi:MAG TPA: tetratricopeptide repeat protein [Acetobacteraceae bacterium]